MSRSESSAPPPSAPRRFAVAFTRDLVDLELPTFDDGLRARTAGWVIERIDGSGEVTRAGLRLVGAVLALGVLLTTGRRYALLPEQRRVALARRLAASRLPLVADYVRALRSLAITYAYEHGPPALR